jgi:uroporphyrinogen-III synthase
VRLLITRPQPDAERTAAALRADGHSVMVVPLLRIEPLLDAEIGGGPWAAILVTSANAARAIADHRRFAELRTVPAIAVGERSAAALRAAGFAAVSSAAGAAADLTRLVAARLKKGVPLLYLAGADRSGDIAGDLSAQGFPVDIAVIYRVVAASIMPPAAAEALANGIDGVLHFSRRSAEAYVSTTRAADLEHVALKKLVHFCMSAQVAETLARAGAADIRVAGKPTEAALLGLIGRA